MKSNIHMKVLRTIHAPSVSFGKGDNPTKGGKKMYKRIAKKRLRAMKFL